MSRARIVLAMLFCAALLMPTPSAEASSSLICTGYTSCAGKGYSNYGYSSHQSTSYWRMYTGTNCTNYVAYRLVTTNGLPNTRPKSGVGNAQDWGVAMKSSTNSTPSVGSVAWWGRSGHHVAYVEKVVSASEIWVSESNWSGAFDWRKITKTGSGWPDGFIHFKDLKLVNKVKPVLSGTVKVGGATTVSTGDWSPKASTYAYQWLLDGKAISGATAKTYTPTAAQLSKQLSVSVTAARTSYPSAKVTTTAVKIAPGSLTATKPPAITGTARVDSTLTASAGTWAPTGAAYAYQWLVSGTAVPGATATTFKPAPADVGRQVTVRITAAKTGYASVTSTSAPTGAVAPGPLEATTSPSVTGTAKVGSALTARPGTWSKPGLSFTYQWFVGGTAVSGAAGPTFVPRAADVDQPVTVHVTGSRTGYATTTAIAPQTAKVVRGTFALRSRPTISGKIARVGAGLTATPGAWSPTGTFTYQWFADGVRITGATGQSFVPSARQRGAKIHVRVTVSKDGYASAYAESTPTAKIGYGYIYVQSAPKITGSPRLGTTVAVSPGTHAPTGAAMRYQWLRDGKVLRGATGRTHKVSTADLGHRFSAKVTFSASGYTSRTITTARTGWAKAASSVKVSAVPGKRQVAFTIRVTASGLAAPDGTVLIHVAGAKDRTVKVTKGRASLSLTGQAAGPHTYVFTFQPKSTIFSSESRTNVTIG